MKTVLKKLAVILMCMTLCAAVTACNLPFVASASEEEKEEKTKKEKKKDKEPKVSTSEPGNPEIPDIPPDDPDYPEGPNGAADDDYTGYLDLLGDYYYALQLPTDTYMDHEEDGFYWLADFRYTVDNSDKDALELVGFSAHDYSGDGGLELIIAGYPTSEWDIGTDIKAIFTMDENGEYRLAVEGWGRNRQYMLDNGEFYNEGSSGATESCFGTYKLTKDGTGIEWTDFYFSTYNGVSGKVEYYHNTTGIWDASASEKMKIKSDSEFWDLQESYQKRIVDIDLKPLYTLNSALGYSGACIVYALPAASYDGDISKLKVYDISTDDYPQEIILEAYDDVTELTLCDIEWGEDRGGEQDFTLVPLKEVGDLHYNETILVKVSFPGDMSTLYYDFKDSAGIDHCYYVTISGRDGETVMGMWY